MDRLDDNAGLKPRPIFLHTDFLRAEFTITGGGVELLLRLATLTVFRRKEPAEVHADRFLGGIPLHSRRALVPRFDFAIEPDDEDGVIRHAGDGGAVLLFTGTQRGFGITPRGA